MNSEDFDVGLWLMTVHQVYDLFQKDMLLLDGYIRRQEISFSEIKRGVEFNVTHFKMVEDKLEDYRF